MHNLLISFGSYYLISHISKNFIVELHSRHSFSNSREEANAIGVLKISSGLHIWQQLYKQKRRDFHYKFLKNRW